MQEKKLPIAHVCLMRVPFQGVINQMRDELRSAKERGVSWRPMIFVPNNFPLVDEVFEKASVRDPGRESGRLKNALFGVVFRYQYVRWLFATQRSVKAIAIRYAPNDPFLWVFTAFCKVPYFTVHHTIESEQITQGKSGIASFIIKRFEGRIARSVVGRSWGVIAVTPEILEYEIERVKKKGGLACVYPNGIFIGNNGQPRSSLRPSGGLPVLVFVADTFQPWHGLDLILSELPKIHTQFELHLVGQVPDSLKALINGDNRVVLHGRVPIETYRTLYETADLAISTLAPERAGLKFACPLKVRDYLSHGVPVYGGHEDIFPKTFPYFKCGHPGLAAIVDYAAKVQGVDKQLVKKAAIPYIDKQILFERMADSVRNALEKR